MSLRRYVSMDDNKRYKLFKLFLIFTILNVFGLFLYENISENGLFRKRPEFYIESIKLEDKSENDISKTFGNKSSKGINGQIKTDGAKYEKVVERKILIIGDSNVYLMSQNEEYYKSKYKDDIYWLAESGANTEFIAENLTVSFGKFNAKYVTNSFGKDKDISLVDEIRENGITDVVVLLGVNSLKEDSAKVLCDRLTKLDELSKTKTYYVSVLPYVNKSKYKIQNKEIIKFNEIMKEGLSSGRISYINAYGLLTATEEYKNETTDGLHYSSIIYDKIFEEIISSIMQNS